MNRVIGATARQLDLLEIDDEPIPPTRTTEPRRPNMRVLRKDVYVELARRRRRAQIAARHLVDRQ